MADKERNKGTNGTKGQRKSNGGATATGYEQQGVRNTAPNAPRPSTLARRPS